MARRKPAKNVATVRTDRGRGMLLLSDDVIQRELTMEKVIDLVEEAFTADARGRAITFPAIVDYVGKAHAHFGIKSGYLDLAREVLGLKAGGYWFENQARHGLPNHRATMLLINPDTGEALAVMPAKLVHRKGLLPVSRH